jgi:hypothetical protein
MLRGPVNRMDRLLKQKRKDVYGSESKISESAWCSKCGVVFMNGRWKWMEKPLHVVVTLCPACRRITDNFPAGLIDLQGIFYLEHLQEIMHLIARVESQEKKLHPLERIIAIDRYPRLTRVSTTGIHLARRIGEALHHSYKGQYRFTYAAADKSIRVFWKR